MFAPDTQDDWSRLGLYRSRDVLERLYLARHGGELNAGKAKEVIANFEQAQQYFESARTAGVLAGPLEQYYGVLSFARGLILYLTPKAREANLTKGHGIGEYLPEDGPLEGMRLTVQSGTFDEFLDSTGNVETFHLDEPRAGLQTGSQWFTTSLPRPAKDSEFSFDDILSRIPGLRTHYEQAFGTHARCYGCTAWLFTGTINVALWGNADSLPDSAYLTNAVRFGPARGEATISPQQGVTLRMRPPVGEPVQKYCPTIMESQQGGQAVVESLPGGGALSQIGLYFAAAHALSTIVRYHPTRWMQLLSRERGDRILPVLERLRLLLQTEFVRLVLTEVERSGAVPP
jgi:hypothetical protein